jgi:tRNA isopentenyl-2-thiomethyl-A-37 hydroxylase MiaE
LADVAAIREQLDKLSGSITASRELTVKIDVRSEANATAIATLIEHTHEPLPLVPCIIDKAAIEAMSDEAIAALAKRLPPLTFQAWLDGKKWGEPMSYRLGETVGLDSKLINPINFPVGETE